MTIDFDTCKTCLFNINKNCGMDWTEIKDDTKWCRDFSKRPTRLIMDIKDGYIRIKLP